MLWVGLSVGISLVAALSGECASQTHQAISFIGFSKNETLAAWRLHISRRHPNGARDRFALLVWTDVRRNHVLATFRASELRHQMGTIQADCPAQAYANPDWDQAKPRALGAHLQKLGHFKAQRLDFKDSLVRLKPDEDSDVQVHAADHKIIISTAPGAPLGYEPVARLANGQLLYLGHVRMKAQTNAAWQGELEVYHAPSGHALALLHRFHPSPSANGHDITQILTVFSPETPLGTPALGAVNHMRWLLQSSRDNFLDIHPDAQNAYHTFIDSLP